MQTKAIDEMLYALMEEHGIPYREDVGQADPDAIEQCRDALDSALSQYALSLSTHSIEDTVKALFRIKIYADIHLLSMGVKVGDMYSQLVFGGLAHIVNEDTVLTMLREQGWEGE